MTNIKRNCMRVFILKVIQDMNNLIDHFIVLFGINHETWLQFPHIINYYDTT